jgi:hypothetical protein
MYRKHLTPDLTQLDKSLRRRADVIEGRAAELRVTGQPAMASILTEVATEFRALAEDLHEL